MANFKFSGGDIWDEYPKAHFRINPVNCKGVMGAGLAKEFKRRYPVMFKAYARACDKKQLQIGKLHTFTTEDNVTIINLPTKDHWSDPSKYQYVQDGLYALKLYILEEGFNIPQCVFVIPSLGCGLGGLDWDKVRPMIVDTLGDLLPTFVIYPPKPKKKSISRVKLCGINSK